MGRIRRLLFGERNRIGRRLIVLIIGFSSLITLILSAVQLSLEYRQLRSSLDRELDRVEFSLPVIAGSLWDFDDHQIHVALESLTNLPSVGHASVRTPRDGERWTVGTRPTTNVLTRTYSLRHTVRGEDMEIGTLEVVASLDTIIHQVMGSALSILLGNGLKTFVVAIFMAVLFGRLVTGRLKQLQRDVEAMDHRFLPLHDHFEQPAMPRNLDEIDTVAWRLKQLGTDLTRAVSALRQSEEDLRIAATAFESEEAMVITDARSVILRVNRAFTQLTGYTAQEAVGQTPRMLKSSRHDENFYRDMWETINRTGQWQGEIWDRRKNGEEYPKWLTISAVRDTDGTVTHYVGAHFDITERKRVEEELMRHRLHLEELVEERTRELVAAKETTERASKAKSEFLSRMSHELRTPMNAILGFSEVLSLESLSPEQHEFVGEIHHAGDHLLELINDLLDVSRIEAGKLTLSIGPVATSAAVSSALKLTQSLVEQRQISVVNACAEGFAVLADHTRLKQILVNLLSNAVKYNREGGSVRIDCQAQGEDTLRLAVTDTGRGIAPELLGKLFQPFERLGAEHTRVDGVGIGLALSQKLAALMGGTVGVESVSGQGSTFWLDLPRAGIATSAVTPETTIAVAGDKRIRVLYIEDNLANLKVVEALFRLRSGMKLYSAVTGESGLELARVQQPDVILLDIHLPGMDGYAVLKALRAAPETCDIPVIALSADAMPDDIDRGHAAGFSGYLTKPLETKLLFDEIAKVLSP